jgi:hypothetical protein
VCCGDGPPQHACRITCNEQLLLRPMVLPSPRTCGLGGLATCPCHLANELLRALLSHFPSTGRDICL